MSSVRLQSLTIQGFKSFATRTLLEFAPGVTAIVGPNGSGKSNVADAIRWVLGSQSPRALRIGSAEDVVFASGNGRAPVGLADVQLTLNNEDTWLPVAFREVVVGRRAFRSGESEYILNKSRVRLRDLLELLAHGGLGPDGHALVAQGLADQALSLKPAQRRELFEGASGVRQYRLQRTESEHKIAEARRNAARVADLVLELKPRVAALRRQARRTEQETRLRERWQATLGEWLTHELWETSRLLTDLTATVTAAKEAQAAADEAVAQAAQRMAAARSTVMALRSAGDTPEPQAGVAKPAALGTSGQTADHAALARQAQQAVIRHERDVAAAEARQEAAQREVATRQQAAAAAAARAASAKQALPGLRAAAAAVQEQAKRRQAQLATLAAQTMAAETSEREASLAVESAKAGEAAARQRRAQAKEGLRGVARRRAGIAKDQKDAQTELAHIADALTEHDRRRQHTQQTRDEAAAALHARRGRLAEITGQRRAAQDAGARGEHKLQKADRALAAARTRLNVLTDVAAEGAAVHTGTAGGTAAPALVERLRVPAALEVAVAAALGAALRWRLVEDLATAGRLATDLATHGGPRTTFVSQSRLAQEQRAATDRPSLTGGRWLDELVECEPEAVPILAGVLGRTYLVKSLDRALDLVQQVPLEAGIRFVTERGELVETPGTITAGNAAPDEIAMLTRERQLRECNAAVARWEREHQEQLAVVEERRARLAAIVQSERAQRLDLRQAQRQRDRADTQLQKAQQTQERLQRDQQWWGSLTERTERSRAECDSDEAEYTAAQREAEHTLAAAQVQTATRTAIDRQAKESLHQLRSTKATVQTEAAVARQAAQTAAAQVEAATRSASHAAQEADDERERAARAAAAAQEQTVDRHRAALAAAKTELAAAEQALREHQRAVSAAERALQEASDALSAARAHAATLASRGEAAETRLQALEERRAALREQAERDLGAVPTELTPARSSPAQLRETAERLRRRLHNLGPINQMAVEEHAALAARLEHLTTQLNDIEATARRLEQLRAEVDQRLAREFSRNIEVVGEHFRDYCGRLLGGEGRLILEDDTPDGGIELDVRLPGRRRQPLAALSGGERALASAALLFALLRARPTLFCVLDEVDAALDETNVVRFCEALEELAQETQFLVITHNRVTMERADALYGVSATDDGVSQVISLRSIRGARAAAAPAAAAG